ncbi:amino acid permease [Nocardia terpenica]|uniref:GABA permease n=1 Tax=Nocardia terpenica TaxID=455432 RepID=A0A164HS98_9NOCA|nr:amino acid permease [Nocardia terpenica]KZM68764.1 GABA permease [Nocardia terpenica]MBF6062372.1 amino acid permease [Nocardia terpenica]MBF6104460.1 amino acid permease [Nocardia terpenica]MBF6109684.1 amino acid permease [Nocardia terpenica]MBF6119990.1 amino acid permease [Nocardia terpenica]
MTKTTGVAREGLRTGLRRRHMTMLAIGGAVGAGLFVGSGSVIKTAGPAAVVSYAFAGVMVLCVLRALGEMVVARPVAGSLAEYSRMALGPFAGFVVGWLYWYLYVVLVAAEATAGSAILAQWIDLPPWVLSAGLMVVMTVVNLISVRSFGEFEFWFASIKVVAIVVFLLFGVLYILGWWPNGHAGLGNLTAHGGFVPNGMSGVLSAIVTVIFAFGGTEIVTLAAAESAEPGKAVARATSNVLWRVGLFYVASIFLVVAILPWNDAKVLTSPFVSALNEMRVPGAGTIMQVVILTAVLSVLNSAIYVSSRMLYVLTRDGDAPSALVKVTRRGVPARAVLLGTVAAWFAVLASYVSPDRVFSFLVNSIGVLLAFMYLAIMFSQLRLRSRLRRENPTTLTYRMWGYPYLSWLVIGVLVTVLISEAFMSSLRPQLIASTVSLLIVAAVYPLRARFGRTPPVREVHVLEHAERPATE